MAGLSFIVDISRSPYRINPKVLGIGVADKERKDVRFETLECEGDISKTFIYPEDAIGKTYKLNLTLFKLEFLL